MTLSDPRDSAALSEPATPDVRDPAAPDVQASDGSPLPPPPVPPSGPDGGQAPAPPRRRPRHRRAIIEWVAILAAAVVAALLLRTFVIQPYFIPSGSMEPTLEIGDKVLVNKLSYDFHGVHAGDIIVFKKPADDYSPGVKDLIKRVIGLPGQTISSGPDAEVFINGRLLSQPWLTASAKADPGPKIPKLVIPAGDYFVMGDNRGNSDDSRVFGPIPKNLIVGRAFLLVWPPSRIGTL